MSSTISVIEKKDFLKWFLNTYQLKRRECAWLLNYLISDNDIMKHVHFVDKAEHCPKALVISSTDVEQIPFCFHKHQHVTMDAEKAFHDIRLNNEEDIYIQLNFPSSQTNPQYVAVLEDNPFLPRNEEATNVDQLLAEMVLDKAIVSFKRQRLLEEINKSLDQNDEQLFLSLTTELNKLSALDQ
ncbi:ReoY family proteolytic degradation factor [Desertibacillus haloalkaliphilus]|uniref:ReoY family proteolytic degradation factor n=1 Tax=Desertibacillus haloalkaliphilus TaxID=1328930 RepID=UPI001C27D4EE|nr:ReoY family proteolytic degradation factor [Desertibacillus haloalkaliphilus]MBU8907260.1 ReoY family proteolytic degradation factor [Desertibacillus haloalkaliphilus]